MLLAQKPSVAVVSTLEGTNKQAEKLAGQGAVYCEAPLAPTPHHSEKQTLLSIQNYFSLYAYWCV